MSYRYPTLDALGSDPGHTLSCARREQEEERRERATRETEPPEAIEENAPVASRSSKTGAPVELETAVSILAELQMRALCALVEGERSSAQPGNVRPYITALEQAELIDGSGVSWDPTWKLSERGRIVRTALVPMFAKADAERGAR